MQTIVLARTFLCGGYRKSPTKFVTSRGSTTMCVVVVVCDCFALNCKMFNRLGLGFGHALNLTCYSGLALPVYYWSPPFLGPIETVKGVLWRGRRGRGRAPTHPLWQPKAAREAWFEPQSHRNSPKRYFVCTKIIETRRRAPALSSILFTTKKKSQLARGFDGHFGHKNLRFGVSWY